MLGALLATGGSSLLAQDSTFLACAGSLVTLSGPVGYDHVWTPSAGLSGVNKRTARFVARDDITYSVKYRSVVGGNLVKNGDFELGNVGFTSSYEHVPGGTFARGTYAILSDPQRFNPGFADCVDSAVPGGKMLVADGSEVPGTKVWCQIIPVESGRLYAFRIYLTSLVAMNPPRLVFTINGQRLGPAQALTRVCDWQEFYSTWVATNVPSAEICVVNDNTVLEGNDFALDRISFVPISDTLTRSYSVTVAPTARTDLEVSLCAQQRYRDNGLDLGPGERGAVVLKTRQGCDSTVTVQTVLREPIFVNARADTLCPGEVLTFQGVNITRDTTICRFSASQFGCDSTYCLTVKFFDETALQIALRRPSCVGDADARLDLNIVAGRAPFTIAWEDGSADPIRTGLPQGSYGVTVTDRLGCRASRTVVVRDPPAIAIAGLATEDARCFAQANGTAVAVPNGGTGALVLTARDSTARQFYLRQLPAGTYTLRATDSLGCFAERPFSIDSPPPVVLELSGDTVVRLGQPASLRLNVSGDSVFARWDFDLRSIDSLVSNDAVAFVPLRTGLVRVVGSDRNGCSEVVSILVRVKTGTRPYFPTAFSPNGDGVNDGFGPAPDPSVARVESFQVYDRWGGMVCSRSGCPAGVFDADCSWDGLDAAGGTRVAPGVYVYVARLLLIDGRLIEQSGDLTLVR